MMFAFRPPRLEPDLRPVPMPDAARPDTHRPLPFTPPAMPPIDQASYDDLCRALATLRVYEDRLAAYEGRRSNLTCPQPCCAPAPVAAELEGSPC